ncbi:hypothetical protein VNO77_04008 [Canavalia gladiata]|uniref:Uncharacterized protein n=1 Tax=Canavalia gladiata TaxID=3824 RepID=A0AAN9MXU5_CANGL
MDEYKKLSQGTPAVPLAWDRTSLLIPSFEVSYQNGDEVRIWSNFVKLLASQSTEMCSLPCTPSTTQSFSYAPKELNGIMEDATQQGAILRQIATSQDSQPCNFFQLQINIEPMDSKADLCFRISASNTYSADIAKVHMVKTEESTSTDSSLDYKPNNMRSLSVKHLRGSFETEFPLQAFVIVQKFAEKSQDSSNPHLRP